MFLAGGEEAPVDCRELLMLSAMPMWTYVEKLSFLLQKFCLPVAYTSNYDQFSLLFDDSLDFLKAPIEFYETFSMLSNMLLGTYAEKFSFILQHFCLTVAYASNYNHFSLIFGSHLVFWKKLQWDFRELLICYQACFEEHMLKISALSYFTSNQ